MVTSSTSSLLRLSALVSALLVAPASRGFAEVRTQGTPAAAHIEVKNARLAEVLRALHDGYGLAYRSDVSLDKRISGTYEGPLPHVIARLLDGTNYILVRRGSSLRIVIVDGAGSRPARSAAAMPIPTSAKEAALPPYVAPDLMAPSGPPMPPARGR